MSDDLTTLDLFRVHHDADQLRTLHHLQTERLAERAITAGERPAGMRLSIADPVRRVKAALDPFWSIPFDEGVGMRGHLLEDYLEVALFHWGAYASDVYESQVPIQWHEHGRSAFDFVTCARDSEVRRVVSCKSSIKGGKPSSANVDQELRMMALAGMPAGSPFEVWVIDPGTFRAVGPYCYTLEEEDIAEARHELAGVSKAFGYFHGIDLAGNQSEWNDPEFWEREFDLASTSGAFRFDTLDASGAIEKRNRAYLRARAAVKQAKQAEDTEKELIRAHVEEQIAAAVAAGEQVKSVRAYSGDVQATYTIDARGAMRCTEKPWAEPATA